MIRLFFVVLSLALNSVVWAATKPAVLPFESRFPYTSQTNHHWFVRVDIENSLIGGTLLGAAASGGYQFSFFGVDMKFRYASTDYGVIRSNPDESASSSGIYSSETDPNSELNRIRADSESWSFFLIEPGVFARSKIFPNWIPHLNLVGRFGVGLGSFSDQENGISFNPILFTSDAFLEYLLAKDSSWGVNGGANFTWGRVGGTQTTRLPISFLVWHFGVSYWF